MISLQTDNVLVPDDSVSTAEGFFESFKGLSFDDAISKIASSLVDFGFRLLIAVFVFYVGKYIIKRLYKGIGDIMQNRNIDVSLITFVLSLVKIVLYFILIITIVGILGIETSSFLALFASAGVAIGLALSGTLQNFAGGVLILLLKPYKVGDFIEAEGYMGTVKAIQIFHTIINTPDNKAIIIPNGPLSTTSINNWSLEVYRRVDWTVSLAYGTDLEKAILAIKDILSSDERIVKGQLEEDLKNRIEEHDLQREEDKRDDDICKNPEEKNLSWWQRIKCHMRLKREKEKIEAVRTEKVASINTKINAEPFVELSEMADSSINITVRAWTLTANYWDVYFEMNKRFYIELPKSGFEFPFPQMDVHLSQQ